MRKIIGLTAALVLFVSAFAFAGGDKVCGDKSTGSAGDSGGGTTTQTRTPNPGD